MEDQQSRLIHSFARNEHEKVNLTIRKYKGKHYLDLRIWFQAKDDANYLPTRKGLTLPMESLPELNQWLEEDRGPAKKVVLTFDDGHMSHFEHVVPALQKRKMKGIFFISAGLVGQKGLMDWHHLRELISQGFQIGSHGLTHQPLSDFTHHQLWKEMQKSKAILEDKLGHPVLCFSVPRGFYQMRIREVALELGYQLVFTSKFDVNQTGHDRYRLNRIAVKRNLSDRDFLRFINGNLGIRRTIEQVKEGIRRFVKPSFYDALAALKRKVKNG